MKIISLIIFTFSICLSCNTVRRDYERLMGSQVIFPETLQKVMKYLIICVMFFSGATLMSCTPKKYNFCGMHSYPIPQKIYGEVLNNEFMFSWPKDILITDSLIVIHDSYNQKYGLHIFRKRDGQWLKSFGCRGRGPGEYIIINSVSLDKDNNIITYDPNLKRITSYNLSKILTDENGVNYEYMMDIMPNFIKKVFPKGEEFIIKGNDAFMRYGLWNHGNNNVQGAFIEYPNYTKDEQANWAICDYSTKEKISANEKYMVFASYIGASLELFEINDKEITSIACKHIFEPEFEYVKGTTPIWVKPIDSTIIGFEDVCITDSYIYGLLWGVKRAEMEVNSPVLVRYDYDMKVNNVYKTIENLETFVVDNDNCMYAVGKDLNGEYKLLKYQLK